MQINRERSFYEKYMKRILDIFCSVLVLILFWWLYVIVAVLVRMKLGSPIVFNQPRPGMINITTGKEKIFNMYKFRTMTEQRNEMNELLPDEERIGNFGKALRNTSIDEMLEIFNILKGDMSLVGPRPQLVSDMVFMTTEQRMRHIVKPGLTGLAQVMGRNSITWEEKFHWDLKYIKDVSFFTDLQIVVLTVKKVFGRNESAAELDVTDDFGDALLKAGKISWEEYKLKHEEAKKILKEHK